ncbi:isopentenyl phosphate kinase [Halomarina ordinaria]|uniref:Isopentenyl phosphate kinase n=1 Tax=Halomarina ordinaria TaxID=3033939 RepID=A0ABD5U8U2_9EURY|nr:isopentenyl phosphate kinase [Halomarina sp. PSRA2]
MKVLKLGGSVITDKDVPETVDERNLERAAAAVGGYDGDLVVVHGGGSFGHHHASAHGISRTRGSEDYEGVVAVHAAMQRLNDAVLAALHAEGVPAVPVHPFSAGFRNAVDDLVLPTGQVRVLLREGFVPVLHGDVVAHEGRGATIVSGDELVVEVADHLDAERVGLCSAVPGVYDEAGDVVGRIESFEDVEAALGGSQSTDVTGGMATKVRELLALSVPAFVFDLDGVAAFLAGDDVGTRIG